VSDAPPPPSGSDPTGGDAGGAFNPPPPPPPPPPGGFQPPPPGGGYPPPPSYGGQQPWPPPPPAPGYGAGRASAPFGAAYAEWWQRFVAYLIDAILIGIVAGILEAASGSILLLFVGDGLLGFLYFGLILAQPGGQSVGMMAMRIRVRVASTGAPLDSSKAFGRSAVQFLPLVIPYLGSLYVLIDDLWPLWDPMRQTLHDKAAGTVVVVA
jgi:uncharacterized RDD family membrane protein YckC